MDVNVELKPDLVIVTEARPHLSRLLPLPHLHSSDSDSSDWIKSENGESDSD